MMEFIISIKYKEIFMKKRYGLDSIIGRKSKLRFPNHLFILDQSYLNSFFQPLWLSLMLGKNFIYHEENDPVDICDLFNEKTCDFEEGFPVAVLVFY